MCRCCAEPPHLYEVGSITILQIGKQRLDAKFVVASSWLNGLVINKRKTKKYSNVCCCFQSLYFQMISRLGPSQYMEQTPSILDILGEGFKEGDTQWLQWQRRATPPPCGSCRPELGAKWRSGECPGHWARTLALLLSQVHFSGPQVPHNTWFGLRNLQRLWFWLHRIWGAWKRGAFSLLTLS